MLTFALAFLILLLVVLGMAVGAIVKGRPITGSCGGLSAIDGAGRCGYCGREVAAREDGGRACDGPE